MEGRKNASHLPVARHTCMCTCDIMLLTLFLALCSDSNLSPLKMVAGVAKRNLLLQTFVYLNGSGRYRKTMRVKRSGVCILRYLGRIIDSIVDSIISMVGHHASDIRF